MSKASKNEDEWCIVFDLQHYSKDQAFELGSAITQGKLRILHDKRIAIVADSRKAAEEYVRQINENLMEGISSPFHFFYTLM